MGKNQPLSVEIPPLDEIFFDCWFRLDALPASPISLDFFTIGWKQAVPLGMKFNANFHDAPPISSDYSVFNFNTDDTTHFDLTKWTKVSGIINFIYEAASSYMDVSVELMFNLEPDSHLIVDYGFSVSSITTNLIFSVASNGIFDDFCTRWVFDQFIHISLLFIHFFQKNHIKKQQS